MGHRDRAWLTMVGNAAARDFVKIAAITGYALPNDELRIEINPAPHKRTALRQDSMGIYSFWRDKEALKVGIASPNDDARFRYHHYSPGTSRSNLALTISDRFAELGLSAAPTKFRPWIEAETGRIDFVMPARWGQPLAKLFEAYLHARWRPRFEGRPWTGYPESLPAPSFAEPLGHPQLA